MKWAKVDASGQIVELVESDQQPAEQAGFTFREASEGTKVGDHVDQQQGSAPSDSDTG